MDLRARYARDFGEDQAAALEAAAAQHARDDDKGTGDPFKWVLIWTIGYGCVKRYPEDHGITVNPETFRKWVRRHGKLATYDGAIDGLSMMAGAYTPFVVRPRRKKAVAA